MIQTEAWSKVKIHLHIKISYKEVKTEKSDIRLLNYLTF